MEPTTISLIPAIVASAVFFFAVGSMVGARLSSARRRPDEAWQASMRLARADGNAIVQAANGAILRSERDELALVARHLSRKVRRLRAEAET